MSVAKTTKVAYRSDDGGTDDNAIRRGESTTPRDVTGRDSLKRKIVELEIPYPKCWYPDHSRRSQEYRRTAHGDADNVRVGDYFAKFDGLRAARVVTIDGMNGCGKSTLMTRTNRKYCKINRILPEITAGSDYNTYAVNGLVYIVSQSLWVQEQQQQQQSETHSNDDDDCEPCIWDRDRYSNLRFYYVHHLMNEYRDTEIPMPDYETLRDNRDMTRELARVYETLNNFALQTHLPDTLSFFEHLSPSPPAVILVNHDLYCVGRTLLKRGGDGDCYRAKDYNYQAAQYHVYMYFAKILKQPVVDLMYACIKFGMTIDDIQHEIIKRVNFERRPQANRDNDKPAGTTTKIDGTRDAYADVMAVNRLQKTCKDLDDQSVYLYSLK